MGRRIAFALVGIVVALTGGLSNALVTANLPYLQGTLGAYAAEVAWLPAAYVMTNMSANLVLVKFRQQFGLRLFTEIFLGLYAVIALAHLFVHSLGSAIAVRAAHGLVGAALSSLGLYYMIQAFPARHRLKAVVAGLGLTQLALPLARVFSTELLEFGEWRGLYLFELGLALFALACVLALKLPPGDRYKVFEKLDAATFVLFAAGSAGLAAVLSLGRVLWWTSTPWLGVVLALSIVLLCAAIAIEHYRARPMLNTRWLANGDIARLILAVLLVRLVLSEQASGAIGFFQGIGLANDQMHRLFWLMLLGATCGVVASALLIHPQHITEHLIVAVLAICIGCFMDARSTSLTRPEQMYLSQFLLAFGSTFFVAPAMVAGIGQVATQPGNLITFVVMFGMAQNMGGLLGSAFLGTLQTVREKFHSSQLTDNLVLSDPQVAARVQAYANAYAHEVLDPAARQVLGLRALASAATREATVLAYNDVFRVIGMIAIGILVWFLAFLFKRQRLRRLASIDLQESPSRA
jgi:MFS family permease